MTVLSKLSLTPQKLAFHNGTCNVPFEWTPSRSWDIFLLILMTYIWRYSCAYFSNVDVHILCQHAHENTLKGTCRLFHTVMSQHCLGMNVKHTILAWLVMIKLVKSGSAWEQANLFSVAFSVVQIMQTEQFHDLGSTFASLPTEPLLKVFPPTFGCQDGSPASQIDFTLVHTAIAASTVCCHR